MVLGGARGPMESQGGRYGCHNDPIVVPMGARMGTRVVPEGVMVVIEAPD